MIRRLLPSLALLFAAPVLAQIPAPWQTPSQVTTQDAAEWARVSGLTPEAAARQLRAQDDTIVATDAIAHEFADRLAGLSVAAAPTFAIDVLLTGDAPVPPRWTTGAGVVVPITFCTGARATRAQLVAALTAHQAEIRAYLPRPPGLGIDPRTGTLAVFLTEGDAARWAPGKLADELAAIAGVPVTLHFFDHRELNSISGGGAIDGGARIRGDGGDGHHYLCTSGFTVGDGTREGVVTAAHCPDSADYIAPDGTHAPLSFAGQWGWSFQDVQLHLATAELQPAFYADTAKTMLRPVTAQRSRTSTRASDVVCHRGETTGYSCAAVLMPDFAPAGDLCGGPCAPTWVAAEGPGCKGGDSGGPVFDGTVALGIVKGGSYLPGGACAFWFYMSTDYLPDGWRVLTAPPALPPVPLN